MFTRVLTNIILFSILFLAKTTFAESADSVKYNGIWYKVYPFDQKAYVWKYSGEMETDAKTRDLFVPSGFVADGRYVQFLHPSNGKRAKALRGREINKISDGRIPYAVFHVSDGKLNGKACFLNAFGTIVEYGNYANNLKQGIWYSGWRFQNYDTYVDGILHGVSYTESLLIRDNQMVSKTTTQTLFDNGQIQEINEQSFTKYNYTRVEKIKASNDNPHAQFQFKKFVNEKLVEEGHINYAGNYVYEWKLYSEETGSVEAELDFDYGEEIDNSFFRFWADNLIFEDNSHVNVLVYGVYEVYYSELNNCFAGGTYNDAVEYRISGEGTQYYPNGQKMIEYWADSSLLIMDTLFHSNGKPKYVAFSNDPSKEYVARYFSESGDLQKEVRRNWGEYDKEQEEGVYYKGYKLKAPRSYEDYYSYFYMPSFDTITNPENGIICTSILHDGMDVFSEVLYDTKANVKTTRFNLRPYDYLPEYDVEILENYNADYSSAHTTITTNFEKRYKVISTYDKTFPILETEDHGVMNMYDLEKKWGSSPGHFLMRYLEDDREWVARSGNYTDPYFSISNWQTTYYLDDKPISSEICIDMYQRKSKVFLSEEKISLKPQSFIEKLDQNQDYLYDRFGLGYDFNIMPLLPDLFAAVPSFYYGANIYETAGWEGGYNIDDELTSVKKITGQFLNGKLQGIWKAYDYSGEELMIMNFDQGQPTGEFQFYTTRWGLKKPRLGQTILYENGLPSEVTFYNSNGDTSLAFEYLNGQAHELSYFIYKAQNDEIILNEIKTGRFENNALVEVSTSRRINGKFETQSIACVNEILDGPVNLDDYVGTIKNGMFTGIAMEDAGAEKKWRYFIDNGVLYKKDCISPEKNTIWQIETDTTKFKLYEYGSYVHSYFPWAKFPDYPPDIYEDYYSSVEGEFKSWYADGTIHSEGHLVASHDKKRDEWRYYNPRGELVTTLKYISSEYFYYTDYTAFDLDHITYNNFGQLNQYKNNKLIYEGIILSYIQQHNCTSDEDYEIRVLYVTKDILEDGTVIERPSRYHYNYYDTEVVQSEGQLVSGLPHGLWKFYDSEGGLMMIGQFVKGKKDGTWFSGDLAGINFLGDFCLNPDAANLEKNLEELQRDLELEVIHYESDSKISSVTLNAYKND